MPRNKIIPGDFYPVNTWKLDKKGPKWNPKQGDNDPRYIFDTTSRRKYWNEFKSTIRIKCLLLTLATPVAHLVTSAANVAYRIVKLVSLSHFWVDKKNEGSYSFKARLKDAGEDLLRIATSVIAYVGLQWAAIYGMFNPHDGRKLYATIERAQYGGSVLAPCFQPKPKRHGLGGDPNQRNAF